MEALDFAIELCGNSEMGRGGSLTSIQQWSGLRVIDWSVGPGKVL